MHSDCEVGLERAKMTGFCIHSIIYLYVSYLLEDASLNQFKQAELHVKNTSLNDAIASTTSLVNVLPTPDDPIKTVGLIA